MSFATGCSVPQDVIDESQVGEARRKAADLAGRLGIDEVSASNMAIVVTELAKNLALHARGGQLLFRALAGEQGRGLEITSVDRGPGMSSVGSSLRDGHSTAGTAGIGLGAVQRLADSFDIYSVKGEGTVVVARIWQRGAVPSALERDLGVVCLPHPAEQECGDGWAAFRNSTRTLLLIADGLGHGPDAAQASAEAVRLFADNTRSSPKDILDGLHRGMRSTRGAAASVFEVRPAEGRLIATGAGNISGTIVAASRRSIVSDTGIVGFQMRAPRELGYDWPAGAFVVLHSDGLSSHWNLDKFPGAVGRSPAVLAALLYRDFWRGRDDVTVIVYRPQEGGQQA